MIRAILFDFDGLILDTESPAFAAWQELFREHGVELDLRDWSAALGTANGFDTIAHLEGLIGRPVERETLAARRYARKRELIDAEEIRPGVLAYIEEAARLGLRLAIVTSDSKSWVTGHLSRLGLIECWHSFHCAENDVTFAKPLPVMYLQALAALGISGDEAIALEDSPNGIAAAKAAGIFCVAVPNALTKTLDLSRADLIIESLDDLPLEELLAQASRAG